MAIELSTPDVGRLGAVVRALRDWQDDASPTQLHPGDLGWYWRHGPDAVAAALRTWSRDGQVLAIGFLDGPEVLRMTVAPQVWRQEELAHRVVADVSEPQRGVLPAGKVSVEAPNGTRVQGLLTDVGSERRRAVDAASPRPRGSGGTTRSADRGRRVRSGVRVHRRSPVGMGSARFTDGLWRAMAVGLPYTDARCLLAYDDRGVAVAGATVWSAGPGKPGLLEPVGVHADHRRHGYGREISIAAAAQLKSGFVECRGLHPQCQHRRRRHLQVRRISATSSAAGPIPRRLTDGKWRQHHVRRRPVLARLRRPGVLPSVGG
jgi:GNAT superfamily N-acetyltransferase